MYSDIAALTFAAVAINHLGLIAAIESTVRRRLLIVGCSKCLSFWSTLIYQIASGCFCVGSVAVSLACAWLAVWLELGMGYTDHLFDKAYEWIYPQTTAADQTGADTAHPDSTKDQMS